MAENVSEENTIAVIPPRHIPRVLADKHEAVKREVMTKIVEAVRNAVTGQLALPLFQPKEVIDLEVEQSNFQRVADALDSALDMYGLEVNRINTGAIQFVDKKRLSARDQQGSYERISDSPPAM